MPENRVQIVIEGIDKSKQVLDQVGKNFKDLSTQVGKSFDSLRTAIFSIQGAIAGMGTVLLAKSFVDAGTKAQSLKSTLEAISGSSTGAAQEMNFLRSTADKLGLDLYAAADAFKGIAAAAKGTTLEGEGVRNIFTAVSQTATVLGLSADQTQGALLALSQMISKGTVAAEELRGQLGERLPGAFQLAARAMGVSTSKLDEMLQKGKIVSEDFLPKLAKALTDQYGAAAEKASNNAIASFNRFKTAWQDLKVSVAESGFMDEVLKATKDLGRFLKDNQDEMKRFAAEIVNAGKSIKDNLFPLIQQIIEFKNALNGDYLEWGLVGFLLFRGQFGLAGILAGIFQLKRELQTLTAESAGVSTALGNIWDVWTQKRDWRTGNFIKPKAGVSTTPGPLDPELEQYRKEELERMGLPGQPASLPETLWTPLGPTRPRKELSDEEKRRRAKLAEHIGEEAYKDMNHQLEANKKYLEAMAEATGSDLDKEYAKIDNWVEDRRKELKDSGASTEIINVEMGKVMVSADEQKGLASHKAQMEDVKQATDLVKQKQEIERRSMEYSEREAQYQLSILDSKEQARAIDPDTALSERIRWLKDLEKSQSAYFKTLDKNTDTADWYAQRDAISSTQKQLLDLEEKEREHTGTFSDGMRAQLYDAQKAFYGIYSAGKDAWKGIGDSFEGLFKDAITNKLKTFQDYWTAFWDMMGGIAAKLLRNQLEKAIMNLWDQIQSQSSGGGFGSLLSGLGSMIGGFFGGSGAAVPITPGAGPTIIVHQGGYIPKFHFGGLAHDEIPAILQRGEYVVSRKGVDALDRINSGNVRGGGGGIIINNYINAVDTQSFRDAIQRDPGCVTTVVINDTRAGGAMRTAIKGAMA